MAATNMLSLDGTTHQNPAGLLSYWTSSLTAGASISLVHNLGHAQTRAFTRNELVVNVHLGPRLAAAATLTGALRRRVNNLIRWRHASTDAIRIRNGTGTMYTVVVKVLALHSAVK